MSEKRCIITSMKKGIKENPTLKKYLDKIVAYGIDEDTALNVMILVWFQYGIKKEEVDKVIDEHKLNYIQNNTVTLKEAEKPIRVTKYKELFDDE